MPSFNCEAFIAESIQSVLDQSYSNWELLIIDDCSSDRSIEEVSRYLDDPRIYLIQLDSNQGAAVARNVALKQAKGRYIAFLDSDDIWLPPKLELQIGFMKQHKLPFTYTDYEKISESGQCLGVVTSPDRVSYSQLLKTCFIGCLTVVYDREFFGSVEMPLIRKRQDYGLWLALLKGVDHARGINTVLAKYRCHGRSISSNKFDAARYTWSLYYDVEKLGYFRSVYYFSFYAVYGLLRHKLPSIARKLGLFG